MTKTRVYLLDSNVLIALAHPGRVRAGVDATAESAKLLLESISSLARHEFWPDDVSYLDMPTTGIAGHRQVTDAYLVLLARKQGGSVATMDQALAAVQAGTTLLE
jgi:predicted nucleic acid-binding protein